MKITWAKVVGLVAILAVLNSNFNWTSRAAEFLCLVLLGAAIARYTELERSCAGPLGKELWESAVRFVAGVGFALVVITSVEVYLAYLYSCSSEFKDTWAYRLCVHDFGPYYNRPAGSYAWGERFMIEAVNLLYEYAHELEHFFFLPLFFLIAVLLSWLSYWRRQRALATAQPPTAPAGSSPARAIAEWFKNPDRPMWFVTGALIVFSLFGFGGGVVEGERESYDFSVATLNAKTKMSGDLGNLREEISRQTREIEKLRDLLNDATSNDRTPEDFRKAFRDLGQDVGRLSSEIDRARNLGATDNDLREFQPSNLASLPPPPIFKRVMVVDVSDVRREKRRHAVPIIEGPADPSGALTSYERVVSDVKAYDEKDLPRYQQAQESVKFTVYRTSGLGDHDATLLANFVLSASTQGSESTGAMVRTLTDAQVRFQSARDQVACLNLILAFGQWLDTDQGRTDVDKVLAKYVVSPAGLVETSDFSAAVAREFPGLSPGGAESFSGQLRTGRSWQELLAQRMDAQRIRFGRPFEDFNRSAVGVFGRLLAGACALRLTASQFQAKVSQLGAN